jgi:hypothetical protein
MTMPMTSGSASSAYAKPHRRPLAHHLSEKMARTAEPKTDTSPRAAGPAGPQFEAKVATHYALAVLAQTEAFGLPGAIVDRLEFQRSGQGHPLDDIIVRARTRTGEQRCLEMQAKRSMSFTEGDKKFAAVAAAIVEGRKKDAGRRFASPSSAHPDPSTERDQVDQAYSRTPLARTRRRRAGMAVTATAATAPTQTINRPAGWQTQTTPGTP